MDRLSHRRRERTGDAQLPYARHVTGEIVALDSGALMTSVRLAGASFDTADVRDLNDRHLKLNAAWRNLADPRLAVWHHLVRQPAAPAPPRRFTSAFAQGLETDYAARLATRRLFVNALYVTLVLRPGGTPADRAAARLARLGRPAGTPRTPDADVDRLEDLARDLQSHLARYGPSRLGLYERNGLWFSEPAELLRLVLTGRPLRVPLVRGRLGDAVYTARIIFGRESLEIRDAAETRFAAMLGLKEYPASTRPGLWDALLRAPYPLIASQSFTLLSKTAAQAVMTRKQNQLLSARDRAASQVEDLAEGLDELVSNRFVMGEHQASVLVQGDTPSALADHLSAARALLADGGLVAAREDLALEAAFWSQFPGAFAQRPRPAVITSRNFAALAPFHTYPTGRARGNLWGPAVTALTTAAGSPFHFSFHVADVGHTFICGPSGSGKTVLQNFLLAQLEPLGAQRVFIDKDRGAELFVRASGGAYLRLARGAPSGLAPLKALAFTPADRSFLAELVRSLVSTGAPLSAADARAIAGAVDALAPLPRAQRSFSALRALLGQRDPDGVGARLERWTRGAALGWVFDNSDDALDLDARLIGLDTTEVLDDPEVRNPLLMYLFHRLASLVDGRRLVIDIDEFWKALDDEAFRALANDGLKTYRKQNAILVLGTQSPADVLRSDIAHTVLEQCATKIYLPNPQASAADYVDGFGLTRREFQLVRDELAPASRRFLVKQGQDSVVAELNLDGLDDALAILSGRTESVVLLDAVRARYGDDPAAWLPHFHRAQRTGGAAEPANGCREEQDGLRH